MWYSLWYRVGSLCIMVVPYFCSFLSVHTSGFDTCASSITWEKVHYLLWIAHQFNYCIIIIICKEIIMINTQNLQQLMRSVMCVLPGHWGTFTSCESGMITVALAPMAPGISVSSCSGTCKRARNMSSLPTVGWRWSTEMGRWVGIG